MPSIDRVRSTASTIFFLPSLERWDRPTAASLRASGVHPGRLAQGPDEKSGRTGREFGFIDSLPYRRAALRWGSVARGRYSETGGSAQGDMHHGKARPLPAAELAPSGDPGLGKQRLDGFVAGVD